MIELKNKKLSKYDIQAQEFLDKTNTTITAEYLGTYAREDWDIRDNYKITISRGPRSMVLDEYSTSLMNSGKWHIVPVKGSQFCNKYSPVAIVHGEKPRRDFSGRLYGAKNTKIYDVKEGKECNYMYSEAYKVVRNENYMAPSNYDVLACLQKYDCGDLECFCSDFGYDPDSKKAEKIYHAVKEEYLQVCTIWNDEELEILREIQ